VGYTGDRLAPLFQPALARSTAHRMAEHGRDLLLENVKASTPVEESPHRRAPGTARNSWRGKPVLGPLPGGMAAEVYETGVESHDYVTLFLEYGTGRHGPHHRAFVIRGDTLRFYSRRLGRWVFRRDVLNPGQRAQRPLATGVALTEHELARVLQPDLLAWKRMVEARARAQ
jgi:hypothetical protein